MEAAEVTEHQASPTGVGERLVARGLLSDRDLEGPVIAETDIALAGGCMNIDSESANTALAFEKRYMSVCFCVFLGDPKVNGSRL